MSFGIYWSSLWREVPGVDDEILTIREFAALMKIGKTKACKTAESRELPRFNVRDQWRFRRAYSDAWIDKRLPPEPTDGERYE